MGAGHAVKVWDTRRSFVTGCLSEDWSPAPRDREIFSQIFLHISSILLNIIVTDCVCLVLLRIQDKHPASSCSPSGNSSNFLFIHTVRLVPPSHYNGVSIVSVLQLDLWGSR